MPTTEDWGIFDNIRIYVLMEPGALIDDDLGMGWRVPLDALATNQKLNGFLI
jgi:hypothetical protein